MPRIEVAGYNGILEFPDEMRQEDIAAVLQQQFPPVNSIANTDGSWKVDIGSLPLQPVHPFSARQPVFKQAPAPSLTDKIIGGVKGIFGSKEQKDPMDSAAATVELVSREAGEPFKKDVYDKVKDIKERPSQLIPFLSGAVELKDIIKIADAAHRLEKNTATEEDLMLLKAFRDKNSEDTTFGYKVLDVISNLPAFAGELLATSGLYTAGKKVTTKGAEKVAKGLLSDAGEELLKKRAAQIAVKSAGGIAGATLQTPVSGGIRIATKAIENEMPKFDEYGELKKGDDVLPAIAKAFGEQWVETVSERSGGLFTEFGDAAKSELIKRGLLKSFLKNNPSATAKEFHNILRKAGWNGIINEMLEERVGEAGRAALGIEKYKMPTPEQLAVELVAFSIPGSAIKLADKALNTKTPIESTKAMQDIDPAVKDSTKDIIGILGQGAAAQEPIAKADDVQDIQFQNRLKQQALQRQRIIDETMPDEVSEESVKPASKTQLEFIKDMAAFEGPETIRIQNETEPDSFRRLGSGRPKWLQDAIEGSGFKYADVQGLLARYQKGESLTDRQRGFVESLIEASRSDYEKYGRQEIDLDKLQEGDKFVVDGEVFKHKGYDEHGNAIIKDGITYKVPPFESKPVKVDEFIPSDAADKDEPRYSPETAIGAGDVSADVGGYGKKSNIQRMADFVIQSQELEADNITGEHSTDVIEKGKQYYLENLYGRKIHSQAINEDIEFSARGLLYLNQKGTPEQQARRFKLLPKVVPVIETAKDIDPSDIKQIDTNHYRYGLLGRFKDGSVVRIVLDEVQREGKKFLSVFDIEDLKGDKLYRKTGVAEPGKQPVSEGTASGEHPSSTNLNIPPSGKDVNAEAGGYGKRQVNEFGNEVALEEKPALKLESPEIVELAKEISQGKYPVIKERIRALRGQALGVFYSGGRKQGKIELKADIFKNPETAAKVLAHEIGHLVDYLPDETMARGNILGRIASLKKYMKSMLQEFPESTEGVITVKERNSIRNEVTKRILSRHGRTFKEFIDNQHLRDSMRPKINEMVKERIANIIEKRGLYTKAEIMTELKGLTQEWKPFDESANPKFTKYRYSPKELYADAFSVLLNDPALLKEKAPKFNQAFFNWLEKKPEVKAVYNEIQERLQDETTVTEKRTENIREMFKKGEEQRLEQLDRKKPVEVMDNIKKAIVDKNAGLIRRMERLKKQGKDVAAEDNPLYWIEELPYISGEVYNHLNAVDNAIKAPAKKEGLTLDDIGEYMLLKRIATERAEIANPLGHTKETAEKQLEDLKERLGDEKFSKLEGYVKKYWELRQKHVFPLLEQADMYSDALMDKVLNNENYATFDILKDLEGRYGRGVTAHIYKQIGTLHEVRNPFIATIMKDAALIRAANVNMAKEKVIDFLKENFSGEIQQADKRWNGKYQEPVLEPPKPDEQGTITILKNGKAEAYYAPKDIAENFKRDPYEASVILRAWQELNRPLRAILVSKNPLWMLRNFIRDAKAVYKQVPGMTAPKLVKYYGKALGDAYQDVFKGKETETVSKMLKGKMLVLDRHFGTVDMSAETELDRMLQSYGQSPVRHRNMVIRPFIRLLDFLGDVGKFSERVPKIAGYKYLTETKPEMSDKEIAHIVRTRSGTPDPYRRGAWHSLTNSLFLFSNIGKEGWRSSWEAYQENKAGYAWKTVRVNVLPKLVLYGAGAGLLGDALKEIIKGISDYDKENYTIIPLGLDENGKSVYLRIPQDFTGQIISGVLWNLFKGKITGKGGLFAYGQEQQPYGLNPYLTVAKNWIQYLAGRNPYNAFYGKYIVPERVFKAGGMKAHQEMLEHTWNELGGSVIHRFKGDGVEAVKSDLEKALNYPPGNLLGNFLKVSNQGLREELRKITEKAGAKEAGRQLEVRDRIIETVNKITDEGRKPIPSDMVKLYRGLVKDGLVDPSNTGVMNFRHMFNRYASRSEGSPYIDAVINAGSNAEKAALMGEYEKSMSAGKYKAIVRQLMIEGHISKGALERKRKDEENGLDFLNAD